MREANPTIKTQEEILSIIKKSKNPISITAIAKLSNKSTYQVRAVVNYLFAFGVLQIIKSTQGMTLVIFKNIEKGNI